MEITPGNWVTKPLVNAGPTVMTQDHSRPMIDQEGTKWPTTEQVCECRSMDDAYLIAAAPDLYEALNDLRKEIMNVPMATSRLVALIQQAKTALAKARGKDSK